MGIRAGGLISGLDTKSIIDALVAFESRPLDLIKARKADLGKNQGLFQDLNTKLLALSDAAKKIDNQNSTLSGFSTAEELLAFTASSDDTTVLTADASPSAQAGTHDVVVDAVASAGREFSGAFVDATSVIANAGETLSIDYGGTNTIDFTAGAGGASLNDLRDAINNDVSNQGSVQADVLYDGTNYRLVVSGTATGAANDISITTNIQGPAAGPFVDATLEQVATDAQLTVFGSIPITRSTNDITDVIPGVTLHLKTAKPGQNIQVNVTRDDPTIFAKVQAFIDAYNGVGDFLDRNAGYDAVTKVAGPLNGDPTIRGVEGTLRGSLVKAFSFAGNPFTSLGQVGVSIDSTGTLSLDQTKLAAALDQDPQALRQLFSGDGTSDGAFTSVARALDPITQSSTGILATRDSGFSDQITSLDDQIARFEERLAKREQTLVAEFSALETTLSALQSQSGSLGRISSSGAIPK